MAGDDSSQVRGSCASNAAEPEVRAKWEPLPYVVLSCQSASAVSHGTRLTAWNGWPPFSAALIDLAAKPCASFDRVRREIPARRHEPGAAMREHDGYQRCGRADRVKLRRWGWW